MGVTFLKRSTLPEAVKGKAPVNKVTIAGNGQVQLSSIASKFFEGCKTLALGFDQANGTLYMFREDSKLASKLDEKDRIKINWSQKTGLASFSGALLLKDPATFGDHIYDYKASGNQGFEVTNDEKNGAIKISLPKGALAAKPVVHREKKKSAPAMKAEVGKTEGTPVKEEELVLEVA